MTHIVLVYVPCCSEGEETVHKQQVQYYWQHGVFACPQAILLKDFKAALIAWWQAGECLIVFLDANEDMTSPGPFHDMLTGNGLHMHEAVTSHHPDSRWHMTVTFQCGDHILATFPSMATLLCWTLIPTQTLGSLLGIALGTTALQSWIFGWMSSSVTTSCRWSDWKPDISPALYHHPSPSTSLYSLVSSYLMIFFPVFISSILNTMVHSCQHRPTTTLANGMDVLKCQGMLCMKK